MNTITTDQFPTFRAAARLLRKAPRATVRLIRWVANRRWRLFFSPTSLKCYLIMATLICLTYTSLRWYGRRAWEAEKERAAKSGMAADFTALEQPLPAAEDNFLAAPIFGDWSAERDSNRDQFKMWFSKRSYVSLPKGVNRASLVPFPKGHPGEISLADWCAYFRLTGMLPLTPTHPSPAAELAADQRWKPIIDAVYEASKRPIAVVPMTKSTNANSQYHHDSMGEITPLLGSIILNARAQLEMGNLSEVLPALRVTDHFFRASLIQGGSFSSSNTIRREAPLLKTGIRLHRWPEATLQGLLAANYPELLQQRCQPMYQWNRLASLTPYQNFPDSWAHTDRFPHWRNFFLKYAMPDYFVTQAMIRSSQYHMILHVAGAPFLADDNWPSRLEALEKNSPIKAGPETEFGVRMGYHPGPLFMFYIEYLEKLLQVSVRHLAIASELYYLKYNRYPATLVELNKAVPLPSVAMKDIDGQPIRYTTNEVGTWFTITSVGSHGLPRTPVDKGYNITFSTDPDSLPK